MSHEPRLRDYLTRDEVDSLLCAAKNRPRHATRNYAMILIAYPTPFLDWTESPFIAAYFAFANSRLCLHEKAEDVRVRIFRCEASVLQPHPPPVVLTDPRYIVGIVRPGAALNPRAVPQQSIFTFSNIVEVDTLLNQIATVRQQPLLELIDIAFAEKGTALRDLRAMGITEASLFPGIDGTCRDLAQLQFE